MIKIFQHDCLTKNIVTEAYPDELHEVFYVIVHKESDSGILFNERMLIIENWTSTISYSKQFLPFAELIAKNAIKKKLTINNVNFVKKGNMIMMLQAPKWVFKFETKDLCSKWMEMFLEQQEKLFGKTIISKATKTSSSKEEEYASIPIFKAGTGLKKVESSGSLRFKDRIVVKKMFE